MTAGVLILLAHPAWRRSRVNRALAEAVRDLPGVTLHDLYETYPDFAIDIEAEQARLAAHGTLVIQHPLYWYSAPAIVKEWLDLVLEHGWAYGHTGKALHGKRWMQAITAGGREAAYQADGLNRFTIGELLRPFEATAALCGMAWQSPHVVHATHSAGPAEIATAAGAYRDRIAALAAAPAPAA